MSKGLFTPYDFVACDKLTAGLRHCRISYREGLGMSPCIIRLTTQDPYILREHIKLYIILKFHVNWANTEQDTAIQKLQNLLRNV